MTLSQMIDITRMDTLYRHRENNPDIKHIVQVFGDEEFLAKAGEWFIEDTEDNFISFQMAYKKGEIKILDDFSIQKNEAVKCLYLPPFYLFIDLNKPYL